MTIPAFATIEQRTFAHLPRTIASGDSVVIDTRGLSTLTVITSAASSAIVSRVDSNGAIADSSDTAANQSVASATRAAIPIAWPHHRITATGGSVRVGLAG